MTDILSKIKPSVRRIEAYTLKQLDAPVKINQNENPFDMPEAIKAAVYQGINQRAWSRYPAFVPAALISKLADFSGWRSDGILVGNGSNELDRKSTRLNSSHVRSSYTGFCLSTR